MLISNPDGSYAPDVPKVRLDCAMAVSCASLFPLAVVYLAVGQVYLFQMVSALTVTSVLADAVFHNNPFFDLLDRYWASACVLCIVSYAFSWLGGAFSLSEPNYPPLWMMLTAVPLQLGLLLAPLSFLQKSRSFPIGSEEWRRAHAEWHYCAAVCCSITAFVSRYLLELSGDSKISAPLQ
mmetsp:Transcript_13676/g.27014  ORF Transcript_13676/g.27014 Transcript_13676/m.27014 type:complete len:180 (+) Transcript_13676:376-915(+)